MRAVEILMIVSIVLQVIAMGIALLLVNKTKFKALWICCIIALVLLSVERFLQLRLFAGFEISDLTFAWVGIVVSLSFSICVVCARFLVNHVDKVSLERRILENRLMTAVLRTEERSRASFSRELHDGLGPLLSSAKMSLSALQRIELSDKDRLVLQNSTAAIDEAIRSLREISNNLSPHILNNFGLARGIKNFVDRLGTVRDTHITFSTTLGDKRFDSNIEVIIYRVVCELINNSLKHASCTDIDITLKLGGKYLSVEYRDNGCGFSVRDVESRGMGLSNIRSRVSSLNGKFTLSSRPGEGMQAKVSVAIDGTAANPTDEEYETNNRRRGNDKRRGKDSTR
ncbi:MAG: sensor histidine kinase [Rikenellaceae bacterium]|nr:sensor histidine kinase [Rikenellaceae bacterium]